MELDHIFVQAITNLYDELTANGIYIVYIGKFTQSVTTMFSNMLEEELEKRSEDKKIKKRVYHAMVETMQNIQRHSLADESAIFSNGLFMIGKKDNIYYVITINKINAIDKPKLIKAIEHVNAATVEELNEMYKQQLKNGKIGEHGGAGLGLIDIARKTRNKLHYLFVPINVAEEYFVFKAEVNPDDFIN